MIGAKPMDKTKEELLEENESLKAKIQDLEYRVTLLEKDVNRWHDAYARTPKQGLFDVY
jgi:predicted nuclease with TOPRIM domain